MGFFDDEYTYGEDDDTDKRLRKIMRVNPNYLEYFKMRHGRYPRREEISQEYADRSVAGQFYWLNDSREELDILHEKRRRKEEEERSYSSDIGFFGALGGLLGLVGGLMFEENPDFYEDEDEYYYEDEDDY